MAQTVSLMASPPLPVPETTTTCQDQPKAKLIQLDFKVKVHETTILPPIQQTEIRKCCFLSNLDQSFNFYVSSVHFFSGNPDFPIEKVVRRLKAAVQKVLVPYDFAAGRVRQNHQSNLLEIDCDATGAGFVVASSEYSLDDIGDDLIYPHPGYKQLAPQNLDLNDPLLTIFQVTSFKCGGFSLGVSTHHLLSDGIGAKMLFENIASQAFEDKPLAVVPCNDRYLLAARSPPRVEFPHPELRLPLPPSESNINIHPVKEEEEELVSKIFKLSSNQINYLREKAKPPPSPSSTETASTKPPIKITSFNVVAALIWRCKALSTMDVENDSNRSVCTLLCAVDIRPRLNPPLPPSYCGNAVVNAYASSKCIELEDKPFNEIVRVISDGVTRVTDEYIRSTLDWIEINKGVPNGDYFISSWWRLGIEQLVYPWGKPIYSLPVMSHVKYVCFLLPPDDHHHLNGGVNVVVTLPVKEMDKFQSLFYDTFKD